MEKRQYAGGGVQLKTFRIYPFTFHLMSYFKTTYAIKLAA